MERCIGSEVVEGERFELTLMIAMEASHPRTSEGLTVFADRNAYERVEFGYGPLSIALMTSSFVLRNSTVTNREYSSMKKAAYRYPPNREAYFISLRSTCRSPGSGVGT